MLYPMLITLTGESPNFLGRSRKKPANKNTWLRKIARKKNVRRGAAAAAFAVAPGAAAAYFITKAVKRKRAAKKAKRARAAAAAATQKAAATPTPETQAAAKTATIQAAAATAQENTAAKEEQEAPAAEAPENQQPEDQQQEDQLEDQQPEDQPEEQEPLTVEQPEIFGDYDGKYKMNRQNLNPLYVDSSEVNSGNFLGFLELSKDEQIAKAIYEATGDKTFKGFLPLTWNTAQVVKMRDIAETLKEKGKLTALNMAYAFPSVSQAAHAYFIKNAGKIAPLLPSPVDIFKALTPVLWIAGIAAAAYLLSQVKGFIPKGKTA